MKVRRSVITSLKAWKERPKRLPLIFRGVRQVGKTSAVNSFGQEFFPEFLRIDLERDPRAAAVFRSTRNPTEIVEQLGLLTGVHLSNRGLLFIDEIQTTPQALTSLKYFAEDLPDLAVIAAGSLLGILLASLSGGEDYSFPSLHYNL